MAQGKRKKPKRDVVSSKKPLDLAIRPPDDIEYLLTKPDDEWTKEDESKFRAWTDAVAELIADQLRDE